MSVKNKYPLRGAGGRGGCVISGEFTLGSSGAISAVAGFVPLTTTAGAFGVIKTATKTGRYSVVLDRKYKSVRPLGKPSFIGPTDAAFGNTNSNQADYRNRTTSGFDIQLELASSGADTDAASGYVVCWAAIVEEL